MAPTLSPTPPRRHAFRRLLRRIGVSERGVALLEFAFALPLVLGIGMYAIELANYARIQLKVSQVAMTLADNASRVGVDTNLATQQIREADINDVFQGLRIQSAGTDLTTNGRITLSSLEVKNSIYQWIHWQRCIGVKSGTGYDSTYGHAGDGGSLFNFIWGMGDYPNYVQAPVGSAVMFVEVNYDYKPLISNFFLGAPKLHYISSFIVRDNRDLDAGVTNPDPAATAMTCDSHTA